MSLEIIILSFIFTGIVVLIFLQLKKKETSENDKIKENKIQIQLDELKSTMNSSISNMANSFNSLSQNVTKDMSSALTSVNEKVNNFNFQVSELNKSQESINKILAGVKKYGTMAEFSLESLLKDLLPASQYSSNVKMKEDTSENVEFAIKLQDGVLVPVDSHFPVERYKAIQDAHQQDDKKAMAEARTKLARAFKEKAKSVNEKYIVPPKSVDFAIVYAPTESLFLELANYQDPSTKELLTQELMKKYKVTIMGPNNLSGYLQSLHMGFQSLRIKKHASEIYDHLKKISTRFNMHFNNVLVLRKKLEEAMSVVDSFGKDARAINRSIDSIKNPNDDDDPDPDTPSPISSYGQVEKRKVS